MAELSNNPPVVVVGGEHLVSTIADAHVVQIEGNTVKHGPVEAKPGRWSTHPSRGMFEEPVRVSMVGDEEVLIYNTSRMVIDKLYEVTWKGDYYALKRSVDRVGIFKFYPDEDGA